MTGHIGYGPNGQFLPATSRVTWEGSTPSNTPTPRMTFPRVFVLGLGTVPQITRVPALVTVERGTS